MSTVRELLARSFALFRKDPADRLDEEMKAHAELLASDYVARGMTETDAHYAALRELGNISSLRQTYREQSSIPALEDRWLDLKYALRTLSHNPTFTASCIATLTVGLASMITVLCVVSAFLWRPLPYPHPEGLVVLKEVDPRNGLWPFSEPALLDVQERSKSLSGVAAFRRESLALTGAGDTEALQSAAVTPSFFKVLGITPIAGTVFHNSEPYAVISRELWIRKWHMGSMVGSSITLDGRNYSLAGIADLPADLLPGVELLIPLDPKATESRTAHDIDVVARVAAADPGQAQAELNNIATAIAGENARTNAGWGMRVIPLADYIIGPSTSRTIWMIFAAVALLWVLACANVAGLQLARSVSRGHEMSTRVALGASRSRILAQTLTESFLLAGAGAIFGTMIAQLAIDSIRTLASQFFPRLAQLQIDATAIVIAIGCIVVSTIIFGLLSAHAPTFQGGREISRRDRGRDALIVAQVALASVLLLGASLLFQSFLRLRAVNPGFDPERVLSVRVSLGAGDHDNSRRVAFFRSAVDRLAHLPEIESVGATNVLPFSGQGTANRFRVEGESTSEFRSADWRAVTPGFFKTLGVPLKRGRLFSDADGDGALEVVIIGESMAKQFWPNQDAVGKRLLWGRSGNPKMIVGVVGDLRDKTVEDSPAPMMFRPFAQLSDAPMTLLIRTRQDPVAAISDIRRQIWTIDRNVALEFLPLRQAMSDSTMRPRASFLAVAAFALVAMITAAFGLYGLISYRVNQRQQEIGVRLALGAPAGSIRWGVQTRCLLLVTAGAAIGLPLAFALSGLISSLLYATQPTQPSAYLAVLLIFILVALTASFGPARRASRMDPAAALRHE